MQAQYLLNRKINRTKESTETISFLQWNALSSNLDTPESFPKANPEKLKFTSRYPIIAKEIQAYHADFTSLEEIESVDVPKYTEILEEKGFKTVFHQKHGGTDGLAFIWNANKFDHVSEKLDSYWNSKDSKKYTQIYQIHVFKPKDKTDHFLIVGLTHLKAKKENVATRIEQATQLTKLIKDTESEVREKNPNAKVGVVVCGDLNDEPESEPLDILLKGTGFASVFAGELYTTFKIREKEYKRVIDYIFHNDELELVGRNDIPDWTVIGAEGLPNDIYPSDHLSLYAEFHFKH